MISGCVVCGLTPGCFDADRAALAALRGAKLRFREGAALVRVGLDRREPDHQSLDLLWVERVGRVEGGGWRRCRRDATERKIEQLLEAGIIEKKDLADYDLSNYLMASHSVKPHTVRWTPDEVLAGEKTLKDGRTYTLKEAFRAPAIIKVDVIAPVKGVYRDFSVIYDLYDGTRRLNGYTEDVAKSIKQDISYYTQIGNPYKALKRKFALAKLQNDEPALKRYSKIINSKLGKMYLIYSELKTLADLLESGAPVTGLQKLLQSIAPEGMAEDLKQVRTAADYPRLRHIEEQLLAQLSRGTRLSGGRYEPYKAGSV